MKTFYNIALLEGEGLGTAYEYYVKRRFLKKIIQKIGNPKNICIFGLPQNHGLSMDFCLLASDYKADITIVEERENSVRKCEEVLSVLKGNNIISDVNVRIIKGSGMDVNDEFDLLVSTEVLQKYSDEERKLIIAKAVSISKILVFFVPNSSNINCVKPLSSSGVQFHPLIEELGNSYEIIDCGYMDMPPFPSGVKVSDTSKGRMKEAKIFMVLVFLALKTWSLLELILPSFIKKNFAHISYVMISKREEMCR